MALEFSLPKHVRRPMAAVPASKGGRVAGALPFLSFIFRLYLGAVCAPASGVPGIFGWRVIFPPIASFSVML